MSKEKQIEEMAKDLEYAISVNSVWSLMGCGYIARDIPSIARTFNAKGYRKASEVAREIYEEIYEDCFDQFGYIDYEKLAELKKEYTEVGE